MTTFLDLLPRFTAPALCAESSTPDDWHPPAGREGVDIATKARAVCRKCPALGECRTYSLANPALQGLWAGLTERERQRVRRESPTPVRQRTHCINGHRYTEANTRRDASGRRCKTCLSMSERAKRERVAAERERAS